LLTSVALKPSRERPWAIVRGRIARCRVVKTIRFTKQNPCLEDMRVLDYERQSNLMALAPAALHSSAEFGESLKLAVLAMCVLQAAERLFGVPDVYHYALADGIATLFNHLSPWTRTARPDPAPRHAMLLPGL
jgi:hypothetical protein